MQNSKETGGMLHNRVAAGKQPVGVLPQPRKNGFEGFVSFVTKQQLNNQRFNTHQTWKKRKN